MGFNRIAIFVWLFNHNIAMTTTAVSSKVLRKNRLLEGIYCFIVNTMNACQMYTGSVNFPYWLITGLCDTRCKMAMHKTLEHTYKSSLCPIPESISYFIDSKLIQPHSGSYTLSKTIWERMYKATTNKKAPHGLLRSPGKRLCNTIFLMAYPIQKNGKKYMLRDKAI